MIDLTSEHDLDLEIACTIPKEPGFVLRKELVTDFWPALSKADGHRLLTAAISRLKSRGFEFNGFNVEYRGSAVGRGLQVMDDVWLDHVKDCEIYWNKRHKEKAVA